MSISTRPAPRPGHPHGDASDPDVPDAGADPGATDFGASLTRLKALADEKRLRIVLALAGGERCVCELQDVLGGVGQSLLSFHLKTLKEAGLVHDRREGRWVHYALRRDTLEALETMLRRIHASGTGETAAPRDPRCR